MRPHDRRPELQSPLDRWVGRPITTMLTSALIKAAEVYRGSGHRAYNAFRARVARNLPPHRRSNNNVKDWSHDEIQTLLISLIGVDYPDTGMLEKDWDPEQAALADAVLYINATKEYNEDWKRHIGSHLFSTVGGHSRRHSKSLLASFLSLKGSGQPGAGLLQDFNPPPLARDCVHGRPSLDQTTDYRRRRLARTRQKLDLGTISGGHCPLEERCGFLQAMQPCLNQPRCTRRRLAR